MVLVSHRLTLSESEKAWFQQLPIGSDSSLPPRQQSTGCARGYFFGIELDDSIVLKRRRRKSCWDENCFKTESRVLLRHHRHAHIVFSCYSATILLPLCCCRCHILSHMTHLSLISFFFVKHDLFRNSPFATVSSALWSIKISTHLKPGWTQVCTTSPMWV